MRPINESYYVFPGRKAIRRIVDAIRCRLIMIKFMILGPPRTLNYSTDVNAFLLRTLGAKVGQKTELYSPLTFHSSGTKEPRYHNLKIGDRVIFGGNNYIDLTAEVILESGVSLGPGVIINTHNHYNLNEFLETRLPHTCAEKGVVIGQGSGIKAGALISMGVTIGENAVVFGGAVVNRDVPSCTIVAGIPAKAVKVIE